MSRFPYPTPYAKLGGPRNIKNKWEKWKLWGKQQCLGSWLQGSREGHHYPGDLGISALSTLFLFCWSGSGEKMSRFLHTSLMRLKAAFLVGKSSVWVRRKRRSFHGNAASGWDQEVITCSPQGGLIFFLPPFTATKRLKQGFLSLGSLESVLLLTTWGLL